MEIGDFLLAVLIFAAAVLYSSVGHAGASGYLAAMALFGLAPAVMKPAALLLNIFVSTIATYKFWKAGHFSWRLLWPFVATSIPATFVGGTITLPEVYYKPIVGLVLLYSAWRMAFFAPHESAKKRPPRIEICMAAGTGIGFLSGLVGVGGGIFLSPLLLLLGWAGVYETAAVSAAFILVNSIAGLAGNRITADSGLPAAFIVWAVLVVIGGYLGSHFGSRRLNTLALRRLMAVVLVVAGVKLVYQGLFSPTASLPLSAGQTRQAEGPQRVAK